MSYEEWCDKMCVYEWDDDDAFVFFNCKAEDTYYILRYMKEEICVDEVDYDHIHEEYYRCVKSNIDEYIWKRCEKGKGAKKAYVYYIDD